VLFLAKSAIFPAKVKKWKHRIALFCNVEIAILPV